MKFDFVLNRPRGFVYFIVVVFIRDCMRGCSWCACVYYAKIAITSDQRVCCLFAYYLSKMKLLAQSSRLIKSLNNYSVQLSRSFAAQHGKEIQVHKLL